MAVQTITDANQQNIFVKLKNFPGTEEKKRIRYLKKMKTRKKADKSAKFRATTANIRCGPQSGQDNTDSQQKSKNHQNSSGRRVYHIKEEETSNAGEDHQTLSIQGDKGSINDLLSEKQWTRVVHLTNRL